MLVELVYGRLVGSLALVADAGHNLSDVLSLLLTWLAFARSRRWPSARHTCGAAASWPRWRTRCC